MQIGPKIVIVGCGGVGGFLGARLIAAGYDVHFIARGMTLRALRETGLHLSSPFGNVTINDVRASQTAGVDISADLVFICVKLWDTDSAFAAIANAVKPHTAILSFQNGVRAAEDIGDRFSQSNVVGAVCYVSARQQERGRVVHTGTLQRFVIGELDGLHSERVNRICECLVRAGMEAEISLDILRNIWEKFVFLVSLSGVTATMRSPIGRIRTNRYSRAFLHGLLREVTQVARAKGVALDHDFAERQLSFMDTLPPEMTSSMYADLMKQQRLELPWLSEDVANLGQELSVPTPLNDAVRGVLSLHTLGAGQDSSPENFGGKT